VRRRQLHSGGNRWRRRQGFAGAIEGAHGGQGKAQLSGLDLPFSYQTKGPLLIRRLGSSSELDAFFVDGETLYLFRRQNFWEYTRAP
jgi:hypothetical protein